jgi:hypothetical protein
MEGKPCAGMTVQVLLVAFNKKNPCFLRRRREGRKRIKQGYETKKVRRL